MTAQARRTQPQRISEALQRYAVFDYDSAIKVQADSGTITLSGHVSTWEEHDAAIQAAWMGQGVKEVGDQMAVTGGPENRTSTPTTTATSR